MISSIRGEVLHTGLDHAVIDVSGFGLHVSATAQTLSQLRVGEQVMLRTSYVPRQDEAPLLFGFAETGSERSSRRCCRSPAWVPGLLSPCFPCILRRMSVAQFATRTPPPSPACRA
ncbi:hypothetical protein [Nesterenkonia pannonica]|uniref:OB-fold domain-containing protein n=1 Tax=Nesterenkonia pannonica TaxID=1548602 RepID=UPI0021649AD1|nr:OB-fold domain-containing protein [Nesterenkonia pannonica]